jgi:hypothetical protein
MPFESLHNTSKGFPVCQAVLIRGGRLDGWIVIWDIASGRIHRSFDSGEVAYFSRMVRLHDGSLRLRPSSLATSMATLIVNVEEEGCAVAPIVPLPGRRFAMGGNDGTIRIRPEALPSTLA